MVRRVQVRVQVRARVEYNSSLTLTLIGHLKPKPESHAAGELSRENLARCEVLAYDGLEPALAGRGFGQGSSPVSVQVEGHGGRSSPSGGWHKAPHRRPYNDERGIRHRP